MYSLSDENRLHSNVRLLATNKHCHGLGYGIPIAITALERWIQEKKTAKNTNITDTCR